MRTRNAILLLALALGGASVFSDSAAALSRPMEKADDVPTLGQLLAGLPSRANLSKSTLAQAPDPDLPDLLMDEDGAAVTDTEPSDDAVEPMLDVDPVEPSPPITEGLRTDPNFGVDDLPPESLLADPNPLAYPAFTEEVVIDQTTVVTLEEAIELAYFNNPDLQAALLLLEQSEAALAEAQAAFSPTVDVNADTTVAETTTPGILGIGATTEADLSVNSTVDLNYNLFTAGQREASVRAAEAQVRNSELEVERRQEALRLTTATLYYDLQEAIEQIRINQAFVEQTTQNLRDNRIRFEEGVGTRFDVLRAEVQFANARQNLIQSRSQSQIAQRDLARLLNLPPTQNIQSTPVARAENWPLTLEESIILAFQNRAELEQALAQREASEQLAIAARAANGPQISLFAQYRLTDILDDFNDTYAFGARFNMRLIDGGAARARGRQQDLAADVAEQTFAQTLDQVRFDVEQAYYTLLSNEENISTAQIAVSQAQEALRLANLRLENGVGTQLDVLDAQSELVQAEGNLVSALLGYNRALAALQRAISNLEATL